MRIAVLVAVHNRCRSTINALQSVIVDNAVLGASLEVFLLDDGSTDGTAEAVRSRFPNVTVVTGDGSLYWNRGMARVFSEACKYDFDYYLWLNDDTQLLSGALATLLGMGARAGDNIIVVGTTCDPVSGTATYGGVRIANRWHRLRYALIQPSDEIQEVDTMNGNCVLLPKCVVDLVGNLDVAFTHSIGDFDYGLRARRLGVKLLVAPGFVGVCARNTISGTWRDPNLRLSLRWRHLTGVKGLPFREWSLFARRHGGVLWPVLCLAPYLRVIIEYLMQRLAGSSLHVPSPSNNETCTDR